MLDEAFGVAEEIDIAKGKFAIPKTFGETIKALMRDTNYKK